MDEDYWLTEGWEIARRMKAFLDSKGPMSINETRCYKTALQQWLAAIDRRTRRRLQELGWRDV